MVKDHSDSERGNPLLPLPFRSAARVLLYTPSHRQHPKDMIAHATALCSHHLWITGWNDNSSIGPQGGIDLTTHCTMSG